MPAAAKGFWCEVTGVAEMKKLADDLKATGEKLPQAFYKGLNESTKELREGIKASYGAKLPKRGGLAALAASSSLTTRAKLNGTSPSVRVVMRNRHVDIDRIDRQGIVQHRVFGRGGLYTQKVAARDFDDPWQQYGETARSALVHQLITTCKERHL